MRSVICQWLDDYLCEDNPMITSRFLDTRDGIVQVKWCCGERALCLYNIFLSHFPADGILENREGLAQFVAMCRDLLTMDKYNIQFIRLFDVNPQLGVLEQEADDLRHKLEAIRDPSACPFVVDSEWYKQRLTDNATERANVRRQLDDLTAKLNHKQSLETRLLDAGWVKRGSGGYDLVRKLVALL